MVFLCHDVNDIFLEACKMARYAEHRCARSPVGSLGVLSAAQWPGCISFSQAAWVCWHQPSSLGVPASAQPPGCTCICLANGLWGSGCQRGLLGLVQSPPSRHQAVAPW